MTKPEKIKSGLPKLTVLLILFCFLYFTFAWPGFRNTNEYSRVFLSRALVDHQGFAIDKIITVHDTQDKSFHKGHYYTNKAPGASFLATPVYLAIRLLEIYIQWTASEQVVLYIIKAVCVSLLSALFLLLLFKFWAYITLHYPIRRALLIAYALGTLVWPYSTLFYGHQLAGMSLFIAFLILFDSRELTGGGRAMFQAGFFCGVAFLIEYPTLLISFLIFVYGITIFRNLKALIFVAVGTGLAWLLQNQYDFLILHLGSQGAQIVFVSIMGVFLLIVTWQTPVLSCFLLGTLIPVGVLLFYHWKCFGGVLQFPYYFETHIPFLISHSRGIAGVTVPRSLSELRGHLSALLQLLVSPYRGLFFYSPFLIFGLSGIVKMIRDSEWRKEGWLFLSIFVVYFLFLSAFSDWEGGWSMGPRHLTPLIPFLVTAAVFQLGKAGNKSRAKMVWILAPLIIIAIALTFIGTVVFPYFPKEFKNPLYDLSWQFLLQGKFAPTVAEWFGFKGDLELIPLLVAMGILFLILLWDLSWFFSRKAAARIGVAVVCLLIAGSLLFLGGIASRRRTSRMKLREISIQDFQKKRISSYMEKEPG